MLSGWSQRAIVITPEVLTPDISQAADVTLPVCSITQHLRHVSKGKTGVLDKQNNDMPQQLVKVHAPLRLRPELLKYLRDSITRAVSLFLILRVSAGEHIQSEGILPVLK